MTELLNYLLDEVTKIRKLLEASGDERAKHPARPTSYHCVGCGRGSGETIIQTCNLCQREVSNDH